MISRATQAKMRKPFYRRLRSASHVVNISVRFWCDDEEKGEAHAQAVQEYMVSKQEGDWINTSGRDGTGFLIKSMLLAKNTEFASTIERLTNAKWTDLPVDPEVTQVVIVSWSEPTFLKKKKYTHKRKFRHTCSDCGHTDQWGGEPNETS